MVKTAKADVVCPAVAAEDPNGLLGQVFLLGEDILNGIAANVGFQVGNQSLGGFQYTISVVPKVYIELRDISPIRAK